MLDGNSDITRCARKEPYLVFDLFIYHLLRSTAVTNRIFFYPKRHMFLDAGATCSELPSNMGSMLDSMNLQQKKKRGELWRDRICIREGQKKEKKGTSLMMRGL